MKHKTWFVALTDKHSPPIHSIGTTACVQIREKKDKEHLRTHMYSVILSIVTHKYILKAQTFYSNATQESKHFGKRSTFYLMPTYNHTVVKKVYHTKLDSQARIVIFSHSYLVSQAIPFADRGRVWSCCNYRVVTKERNYQPLQLHVGNKMLTSTKHVMT